MSALIFLVSLCLCAFGAKRTREYQDEVRVVASRRAPEKILFTMCEYGYHYIPNLFQLDLPTAIPSRAQLTAHHSHFTYRSMALKYELNHLSHKFFHLLRQSGTCSIYEGLKSLERNSFELFESMAELRLIVNRCKPVITLFSQFRRALRHIISSLRVYDSETNQYEPVSAAHYLNCVNGQQLYFSPLRLFRYLSGLEMNVGWRVRGAFKIWDAEERVYTGVFELLPPEVIEVIVTFLAESSHCTLRMSCKAFFSWEKLSDIKSLRADETAYIDHLLMFADPISLAHSLAYSSSLGVLSPDLCKEALAKLAIVHPTQSIRKIKVLKSDFSSIKDLTQWKQLLDCHKTTRSVRKFMCECLEAISKKISEQWDKPLFIQLNKTYLDTLSAYVALQMRISSPVLLVTFERFLTQNFDLLTTEARDLLRVRDFAGAINSLTDVKSFFK